MKYATTRDEMNERMNEAFNIDQALAKGKPGLKLDKEAKEKFAAFRKAAENDIERSYHYYDDLNIIRREFNVWVGYPLAKKYSRDFQRRYEAFCGGWLHFWDKNISLEVRERQLYIIWEDNFVILFISRGSEKRGYRVTLTVEGPGDPPVAPPPPPPGDA